MVWEFPAVSQSRVEFWKEPQFTQSGMWWFTLFFGLFGLHHMYLRSPQTALIFFIANIFTFGYPWLYDLVQLSESSLESLNKHGLAHPFGALGLAQGMWKKPEKFLNSLKSMTGIAAAASAPAPTAPAPTAPAPEPAPAPTAPEPAPTAPNTVNANDPRENKNIKQSGGGQGPPNPLWFLLYSLLIPIAPLAQMIAGDVNNSVSRFLDLTIIPLGFLFYLCAFIYDYFILFFYPADLLVAGSKRFFPFTYLGMDLEGHSERLTGVSEIKPCPADGFILTMLRISLPFMSFFFPGLGKSVQAALDTAQTTKEIVVDQGLAKVQQVSDVAYKVGSLSTGVATAIPSAVAQASAKLNPQTLMTQVQKGGAQGFTALDYTALGSIGAVIAGGLLLSLNRSTENDPPPNPRGV